MADDIAPTLTVRIDADISALEQQLADAARAGSRFSSALAQSFVDVSLKGRGLGDTLRTLGLRLSEIALEHDEGYQQERLLVLFHDQVAFDGDQFQRD